MKSKRAEPGERGNDSTRGRSLGCRSANSPRWENQSDLWVCNTTEGICKFAEMYVMYTIIYNIYNILSIGVFFLSPCHIRLFTVLANYRKIANFLGEILSNRHKLWDQF